jgi:acetoacetyl-CoA synthetase
MAVEAWDDDRNSITDSAGELVCVKPFPCMPIYFWNDPEGKKYRDAYFHLFKGVWVLWR